MEKSIAEPIVLKNLCKTYSMPGEEIHAVRDITLTIPNREFIAIMGRSGCGKSTLLQILGTLLAPTSGSYLLRGQEVAGMNEKQVSALRRREIGFVFQQYRLIREYSVWENICMPLCLDRAKPDEDYIMDLARSCGISDKMGKYPDQLSGGEQQRVAIVRAMAAKPSILLADEPTGNLDYKTGKEIMYVLQVCRARFHQTIVMVTHDRETASCADQVWWMEDGQIQPKDIKEEWEKTGHVRYEM